MYGMNVRITPVGVLAFLVLINVIVLSAEILSVNAVVYGVSFPVSILYVVVYPSAGSSETVYVSPAVKPVISMVSPCFNEIVCDVPEVKVKVLISISLITCYLFFYCKSMAVICVLEPI